MMTIKAPSGDLDPEDWDTFEANAHLALSAAIQALRAKPSEPVWRPPERSIIEHLDGNLPARGGDIEAVRSRLTQLLPFGVGNTHPGFFGWVHGSGTPGNLLPEIVAAAMNSNCGGRNHIAIHIERQVIAWFVALFGWPAQSSGLVTSGTSMATIIAAKVARDAACSFTSRQQGLSGPRLTGYVSQQAHSCLDRAFDMLGLGSLALRKIAVDDNHQIILSDLEEKITTDRANGFEPFFLAGTAGTVNTGAIDPLRDLADIARREQLWFHIDGAFGASLMLSEKHRARLSGIEQADSLAFDFHKWMHVNYAAGCVLIRDADQHRKSFATRPDYLATDGEALAGGEPWPVDFGPELSREFRALKVWAHFLEHGAEKIAQSIEKNCDQARYLADQVDAHRNLERLAPVASSICCFRYAPTGYFPNQLDALNQAIVTELQSSGLAAPSTTRLDDKLAIRVNITNHRTQFEDLDRLIKAIDEIGGRILDDRIRAGSTEEIGSGQTDRAVEY